MGFTGNKSASPGCDNVPGRYGELWNKEEAFQVDIRSTRESLCGLEQLEQCNKPNTVWF